MPLSATDLEAGLAEADEPDVLLPDGTRADAVGEPGTTLATPDGKMPWEFETIEFNGDTLEVRKPTEQALAGFSLAAGKYMPAKMQNDLVGLFVKAHLSEDSLTRVFERLLNPDDAEYTPTTLGDLMRTIATLK